MKIEPLLIVMALAGCSSNERVTARSERSSWGVAAAPSPSGWGITLAPIEVEPGAYDPVPGNPYSRGIVLDTERLEALRRDLVEATLAPGVFSSVELPEFIAAWRDRELAHVTTSALTALARPVTREEVLDGAYRRGDRAALFLTVRRHAVSYQERNGWWVPNLFNWAFFVWPAWFVADERYKGELIVDATLLAAGSGNDVWSATLASGEASVRDLDHFERGWQLLGSVRVPDSLDEENYDRIARVVLPYARVDVAARLARALSELGPRLGGAEAARAVRQTLAVVVGVGRYSGGIDDVRFASDDAADFAQLLRDPRRGGLAERAVQLLADERATRAGIVSALEEAARRAHDGDSIVFYFAGYGAEADGEPCLAPYDVRNGETDTFLRVSDVALVLARSRAKARAIVVDASFGGDAKMPVRTLRRPGAPSADRNRLAAAFSRIAREAVVCLACEPGAGALDSRIDKRGLFTTALLQATDEATDENADGAISLSEAFPIARTATEERSTRAGLEQTPCLLGEGAGSILLARVRRP